MDIATEMGFGGCHPEKAWERQRSDVVVGSGPVFEMAIKTAARSEAATKPMHDP